MWALPIIGILVVAGCAGPGPATTDAQSTDARAADGGPVERQQVDVLIEEYGLFVYVRDPVFECACNDGVLPRIGGCDSSEWTPSDSLGCECGARVGDCMDEVLIERDGQVTEMYRDRGYMTSWEVLNGSVATPFTLHLRGCGADVSYVVDRVPEPAAPTLDSMTVEADRIDFHWTAPAGTIVGASCTDRYSGLECLGSGGVTSLPRPAADEICNNGGGSGMPWFQRLETYHVSEPVETVLGPIRTWQPGGTTGLPAW